MKEIVTTIETKKDAEPFSSWMFKDPDSFLSELAKRLIVKGIIDSEEVIISPDAPNAADRLKIWIKDSVPYGIGKLIDGDWKMAYFGGMPVNIPFIKEELTVIPEYVREISKEEILSWGLPKIATENVTKIFKWYIFEPKEITYN